MEDFQRLLVYQKARALSARVAQIVLRFPPHYRRTLGAQLDSAAESIGANIAEGAGRKHRNHPNTEFVRYLHIAVGSANELQHRILGALDRRLVSPVESHQLTAATIEVRRMLAGLIKGLEHRDRGKQVPTARLPS